MMKRIGIIGAGAAGLSSLRHCLALKGITPIIWEKSATLGGTWVFTKNTGLDDHNLPIHSSMYESLRTNLPKEIMGFPDFPFKSGGKSFIHHSEVLQYLQQYADHFHLNEWIKFEHNVESVEKIDRKNGAVSWEVCVKNLKDHSYSTVICDGILVCNGHYSIPRIPNISQIENFKGTVIHSHEYRTAEPFRNLTVIVLGAAASGMDISLEVSSVANKVYLSHNFVLPIPSKLPSNMMQVRGIEAVTSNGTFVLVDGTQISDADVLLLCTGYEYSFEFLRPSCKVRVENNRVMPLYKHLIHSTYPSMAFVGIVFKVLPFPLFDIQIKYFLAAFTGNIKLPPVYEMRRETEREFEERGSPLRHFHMLLWDQWAYMNDLGGQINQRDPRLSHLRQIFEVVFKRRLFSLTTYKQFDYRWRNEGQVEEYLNGRRIYTPIHLTSLILFRASLLCLFNFPRLLNIVLCKFYAICMRSLRN